MTEILSVLNGLIADNAPLSVAAAFLLYIGTQLVLAHFKHRADRRAYRYERSSTTGRMRFEKESFHIEQLSSALLGLVTLTESLAGENERRLSRAEKDRWMEVHRECVLRLGAAAPFINYLSPVDGSPYCGVRRDATTPKEGYSAGRFDDGTNDEQVEHLRSRIQNRMPKSLYLRAALLIDACRQKMARFSNVTVGSVLAPGLFHTEGLDKVSVVFDRELDLAARYERFVNCASCRLRDSETGSKDARWQRVKDWFARIWKWFFAGIYHHFDPRCPYENPCDRSCRRDRWGEVARTVASCAFLAVGICGLIFLLCRIVVGNAG